jgi:hypothetical protein
METAHTVAGDAGEEFGGAGDAAVVDDEQFPVAVALLLHRLDGTGEKVAPIARGQHHRHQGRAPQRGALDSVHDGAHMQLSPVIGDRALERGELRGCVLGPVHIGGEARHRTLQRGNARWQLFVVIHAYQVTPVALLLKDGTPSLDARMLTGNRSAGCPNVPAKFKFAFRAARAIVPLGRIATFATLPA